MLASVFNALPDWAVATILACLLWYGVNYAWLGPHYFEALAGHSRSGKCASTAAFHGSGLRGETAYYTATLGIMGDENDILDRACRPR